jgi:hypothetical protein
MTSAARSCLPPDMHFDDYVNWLQREYEQISLEPNCIEIGPFYEASPGDRPPWKLDWCIRFSDQKYLKIKERWLPRAARLGGGGFRHHFAFHYGDANPLCDLEGIPIQDNKRFATIIRIDNDPYGPHIHFRGEDHIKQPRVIGLVISDADPFSFFRAVAAHRTTGQDFDEILQFKVTT